MDRISEMMIRLETDPHGVVDLPAAISLLVKRAIEQEVDPYVTMGVLVESIAHTLAVTIPDQKRIETGKAVTDL